LKLSFNEYAVGAHEHSNASSSPAGGNLASSDGSPESEEEMFDPPFSAFGLVVLDSPWLGNTLLTFPDLFVVAAMFALWPLDLNAGYKGYRWMLDKRFEEVNDANKKMNRRHGHSVIAMKTRLQLTTLILIAVMLLSFGVDRDFIRTRFQITGLA
jgi:hypothetical protein